MSKKIVLTGGHAGSTGYALVEEIVKKGKNWKVSWLGSKYSIEGLRNYTFEYKILPKIGIKFYNLFTGRIQRNFTFWTIPSLIKIPFGFLHALYLLIKINPDLIVSFGGYAAYPVVIASWVLGKPVILHEQTAAVGRANKASVFFAKKILISKESSKKYFPKDKTVNIGNPISSKIAEIEKKDKLGNPPTLAVIGGSRGSIFINKIIDDVLDKLLNHFEVIHQTGDKDFEHFEKKRQNLNGDKKKRYSVDNFLDPHKMVEVFRNADIILSRAGANIVSEIIAVKRPSILIPLPISYLDEQNQNAQYAKKSNIATIIQQKDAASDVVYSELLKILRNWNKIINNSSKIESPDIYAAAKMVDLMEKYLN